MTRTALLTVGSTAFTSLVHSFLSLDTLAALRTLHITHVVAQVGNSALPSDWTLSGSDSESVVELVDGLHVTVIKYAHDLEHRVAQASLVVSHAGAGSILSFVRPVQSTSDSTRILVIVPNSSLMDSHQADLADQFETNGWAVVCREPSSLAQTLSNLANNSGDAAKLPTVPFPSRDPKKMQQILDETLGFAHR